MEEVQEPKSHISPLPIFGGTKADKARNMKHVKYGFIGEMRMRRKGEAARKTCRGLYL